MTDKQKKVVKFIIIGLSIILVINIGILIYLYFFKNNNENIIDGINSIVYEDNKYISAGSSNLNDEGYEKAKISMYDKDREKEWEKVFTTGINSTFYDVIVDDTGIIAVGSYEESEEDLEDNLRSGLLVKYDSDGNLLFNKTFQILGNSKLTKIISINDGYLVTGQSIYENSTLGLSTDGGAFLLKYSKDGDLLWQTNYGGSKSGVFNDLVVYKNHIYVVGKDYSRVGIIAKYTMEGKQVKVEEYNFTDTIGFTAIKELDGDLVVAGAKKVVEDENDYDTDGLLLKYDTNLKKLEEKVYRGKGIERFNQLEIDQDNNIVVIGTTGIYNKKESNDSYNVFNYNGIIAKYEDDFDDIKVEEYSHEKNNHFTDIVIVKDNYIVTGYSEINDEEYLSKIIEYSSALKILESK